VEMAKKIFCKLRVLPVLIRLAYNSGVEALEWNGGEES
jgi:hypothetical protein